MSMGWDTHYKSMGRDVLTKWVSFSESSWNGDVFQRKKSGKGFKYTCLERGSCLSEKWVVNYLSQIKTLYINLILCGSCILNTDDMQVNPCKVS